MKKWTYITTEDHKEMKKLAKKYGLPVPSQIQLKEEKNETKKEDR